MTEQQEQVDGTPGVDIEAGDVSPEQFEEVITKGRYISAKELSSKLSVTRAYVCKLLKEGRIKGVKPFGGEWRIPQDEAKRVLQQGLPAVPRKPPPRPKVTIRVPREEAQKIMPEVKGEESPSPPEPEVKKETKLGWDPLDPYGMVK